MEQFDGTAFPDMIRNMPEVDVPVDYRGYSIPDVFVIGYGIDYAQRHRNLPFVGKVIMNK